MNCFQLIKCILDYTYSNIPGTEEEKDLAIADELTRLTTEYRQVAKKGALNYRDPLRRFAYVYKYTTSHANMVYSCCNISPELQGVLSNRQVNIAAVGGGPGSDFLGLLKYCQTKSLTPAIRLQVFDRDAAWGETWGDIGAQLGDCFHLTSSFHPMDVCDPASWSQYTRYRQADIITMVYFMSELRTKKAAADPFFIDLFRTAKKDAVILFIDNDDTRVSGWYDELAAAHGVQTTSQASCISQMSSDEQASDLDVYFRKFTYPKIRGDIAYRIGVKT